MHLFDRKTLAFIPEDVVWMEDCCLLVPECPPLDGTVVYLFLTRYEVFLYICLQFFDTLCLLTEQKYMATIIWLCILHSNDPNLIASNFTLIESPNSGDP